MSVSVAIIHDKKIVNNNRKSAYFLQIQCVLYETSCLFSKLNFFWWLLLVLIPVDQE